MDPSAAYESAPPVAAYLIESMRGFGYSLSTAIADIIDNSIAAAAENVWLQFHWDGPNSWISILDDGRGMDEAELSRAMRFGSESPLTERNQHDLGRFGLGLKTASLSQCRRLTVASVVSGTLSIRRWDLDFIAHSSAIWPLLSSAAPESTERLITINPKNQGTLVLWEVLDRIVGDATTNDQKQHDAFLLLISRVRQHLAMVFHRYLEGPQANLRIFINGADEAARVLAWDPFMTSQEATIRRPVERIGPAEEAIEVQGFVLPHKDKLSREDFELGAGPAGWTAQQGFYIYRNGRMLLAGDWLGLGGSRRWAKEESFKLARLRLEISNVSDSAWKVDVRKSTASPPYQLRERLRILAEDVRSSARKVYIHRGDYGKRRPISDYRPVWRSVEHRGHVRYIIDRAHPSVASVFNRRDRDGVENMLQVIEQTVPIQRIWLDVSDTAETQQGGFAECAIGEVEKVVADVYRYLLQVVKMEPSAAREYLSRTEPFDLFPDLIEALPDDH